MILPFAAWVQFAAKECLKTFVSFEQVGTFTTNVVVGTDLQIPRIANKRELKERLIKRVREHFLCRNCFCMSWEFYTDLVIHKTTEFACEPDRGVIRVAPSLILKGRGGGPVECGPLLQACFKRLKGDLYLALKSAPGERDEALSDLAEARAERKRAEQALAKATATLRAAAMASEHSRCQGESAH